MTDKYEALKAAALAASYATPWYYKGGLLTATIDDSKDAAYIAAASPDVVLDLIAERDALAAKVKQMEDQEPYAWFVKEYGDVEGVEWTTQKPKCEGDWKPLFTAPVPNPDAKDAERYRWLRDTPTGEPLEILELYPSEEIDAAIDAAIGEKK